jgi:enoyl-CoA hydratase/carnithine racemase
MSDELVVIEKRDRIATMTLNRPPMNPMSVRMLDALHAALTDIEKDGAIRSIVLTGAGERAFCAGADIREESSFKTEADSTAFRDYGRRTLERIENCAKPIVAAIQGYCIGGGTAVGWSCDIRIAADNAVFRAGDAYLGLVPSWGMGLTRLPRLVGRNRALDILLLGENFQRRHRSRLGWSRACAERAAARGGAIGGRADHPGLAPGHPRHEAGGEFQRAPQLGRDGALRAGDLPRSVRASRCRGRPLAFMEKREPRFSDQ